MTLHVIPQGAHSASTVYRQSFSVSYDYPVYFIEHLFDRQNPVFAEALARREPGKRHRFVVFVESHVASS